MLVNHPFLVILVLPLPEHEFVEVANLFTFFAITLLLVSLMVSHFVTFGVCRIHFSGLFWQPEGINKDPTVWLDGAKPPPY